MSKEQDKQKARDAIAAYTAKYGHEIPLSDLRSFVRSETGLNLAGPTLAALLKPLGYIREGIRKIDACPGRAVFYVRAA